MLKKILMEEIKKVVKDLTGKEIDVKVEYPTEKNKGDYSTNAAMVSFQNSGFKSPLELAEKIAEVLKSDKQITNVFSKIEAVSPGFINFWLSEEFLLGKLEESLKKRENFGKSQTKPVKIMVEFAHPNTHKAFHIGHLRNITTGETIVRVLEATGAEVVRANYEGDVGMHIAKAIYALLYVSPFKNDFGKIEGIEERVEFLGKAYSAGNKAFEEDQKAKKEIKDLNYLVYSSAQKFAEEKGEKKGSTDYLKFVEGRTEDVDKIFKLWKETRQWSLDYFETIYKRVYTHFDRYYFESECLLGVDIAKEAVKKGILKEDEGAIIFEGKKYGLDTRVFVNSLGLPTYEAKELALARKEFSEFGNLDKVVHVVGPEQASFFKVTFKVEELLDPEKYKNKQKHLIYGWVKLKEGKMSSRSGNVVLGKWLLDEAKTKILKQFPEMEEETSEKVAVGAVKYSMLKFSTISDISFSFDESISLEGNSGPYLQYTFARTQSVLCKAQISNVQYQISNVKLEDEELSLLRTISRFEEVVTSLAENFSPNMLCNYLFDLAQKFNLFYQKHKIIESEQKDFRLSLTSAVGQVIKNGLYLLGIESPEKM